MLVILPINDRIELLPYSLRYYTALGATRFVCGLYNGDRNPLHPQVAAWAAHYNLYVRNTVLSGHASHYLPDIELPGLNQIREEFTQGPPWYVIADLDEFHHGGCKTLPQIAEEAEQRGYEAVHGFLHDRISLDGSFPEVAGTLDETFPLVCNLTVKAGQCTDKIALARGHVKIKAGHHAAAARTWHKAVQVHHFKWSRGVDERIEAHYLKAKAMGIGWRINSMGSQLKLVKNGVNLTNGGLRVRPAPKIGI